MNIADDFGTVQVSTLRDQALACSQGLRLLVVVHDVHTKTCCRTGACQPPEIRAHSREKPSITSHASFFVPLSRMLCNLLMWVYVKIQRFKHTADQSLHLG
jgi:hypothetical protein